MIVRIMEEGQYRLEAAALDRLNQLDNAVIEAAAGGEEAGFSAAYDALLAYVRKEGSPVPDEELATSDVVLPAPDLSLFEARGLFTGEGLVPG